MIQVSNVIKILFLVSLVAVSLSFSVEAVKPDENSVVSKNFKKAGKNFRSIRKAETADDLIKIFENARVALVANKSEVPSFMKADTPEYQAYLDGMDDTIDQLDKALALAKSNDFEGAKAQFRKVRQARKKYHEQFELED